MSWTHSDSVRCLPFLQQGDTDACAFSFSYCRVLRLRGWFNLARGLSNFLNIEAGDHDLLGIPGLLMWSRRDFFLGSSESLSIVNPVSPLWRPFLPLLRSPRLDAVHRHPGTPELRPGRLDAWYRCRELQIHFPWVFLLERYPSLSGLRRAKSSPGRYRYATFGERYPKAGLIQFL